MGGPDLSFLLFLDLGLGLDFGFGLGLDIGFCTFDDCGPSGFEPIGRPDRVVLGRKMCGLEGVALGVLAYIMGFCNAMLVTCLVELSLPSNASACVKWEHGLHHDTIDLPWVRVDSTYHLHWVWVAGVG